MWSKRQQLILWISSYSPIFLLIAYRIIDKYKLLPTELEWKKIKVPFEFIAILIIILLTLLIYNLVLSLLFRGLEKKHNNIADGNVVYIRKYSRLNVNEYTFFLITLVLPLIALDYTSNLNIAMSLMIIFFIILIYVSTETINSCPLFFVSRYKIFKGIMSYETKEREDHVPSSRREVYIISKSKSLDLNTDFKAIHLIGNYFYVKQN